MATAMALPREPPPEAIPQANNCYLLEMEDGSTIRWTRRPDGTWRPPERTRAGWVGELEQPKYITPARRAQQAGAEVPGMPPSVPAMTPAVPGLPPAQEPVSPAKAKKQPGRQKMQQAANPFEVAWSLKPGAPVHQDKEDAPGDLANKLGGLRIGGAAQSASSSSYAQPEEAKQQPGRQKKQPAANPFEVAWSLKPGARVHQNKEDMDKPRDRKKITKKLKEIRDLEEKQARGEALDAAQLAKMGTRAELEAELARAGPSGQQQGQRGGGSTAKANAAGQAVQSRQGRWRNGKAEADSAPAEDEAARRARFLLQFEQEMEEAKRAALEDDDDLEDEAARKASIRVQFEREMEEAQRAVLDDDDDDDLEDEADRKVRVASQFEREMEQAKNVVVDNDDDDDL